MIKQPLTPFEVIGELQNIPKVPDYNWIERLPNKKIYFSLFQSWGSQLLPAGYDYYIVSYHIEAVDLNWLREQKVTGPIFVLFDGNSYNLDIPGVYFIPFYYWHFQLEKMQKWFGVKEKAVPKYKFSAVCNRISQSKVWTTTKLLESAPDDSLVILNSWLEEKNVHNWQPTGNQTLDNLTATFKDKWLGKEIKIDNFNNATDNVQSITATPWQPLYQDCAMHFTNESFHYSDMYENNKQYLWPGPFLTEKTLKCLLGATAFIPVGQFETYKTLEKLGLKFDYGVNLSWDLDPGNLSRAEQIVKMIDVLNQYTIDELVAMTIESNRYNQNQIVTNQFFQNCQQHNEQSIEKIINLIS